MLKKIFIIALLLCPVSVLADGSQYWQTFSVEGKVYKDLSLQVAEELRFSNDMSHFYYAQTDIGLMYRLTDWFRFGGIYRQVFEDRGYDVDETFDTWRNEKRPIASWTFDIKTKHIVISDRNQFEFRFIDGSPFNVRYRNRLSLDSPFKLKNMTISPYVADEIFVNINDGVLNINRFYTGVRLKIIEKFTAELYYLLQSSKRSQGWSSFNTMGCRAGVIF